jgi:hypothetical protein
MAVKKLTNAKAKEKLLANFNGVSIRDRPSQVNRYYFV